MTKAIDKEAKKEAARKALEAQMALAEAKRLADENEARLRAEAMSNSAADRASLLSEFEAFGRMEAEGRASIVHAAVLFGESVASKRLTEDDAAAAYGAYFAGHAQYNEGDNFAETAKDRAEASKASVSMFRTFGKALPAYMGRDFWTRVLFLRESVTDRRHGSAYNALVYANRQLIAEHGKAEVFAEVKVSDDDIIWWLTAAPKVETPVLDKWIETVAKLLAAAEKEAGDTPFAKTLKPTLELLSKWKQDGKAAILPAPELIKAPDNETLQ